MPGRQRDRVRRLLAESDDGLDAPTVAATLGLHVTTARFHLNNLLDEGSVVTETLPPDGVGRPRVIYRSVPAPPENELLHLLLAQLGDDADTRGRAATAAGRAWARAHAERRPSDDIDVPDPIVTVETVLTRLGFRITEVVSAFGEHQINLCSCPLKAIAEQHPEIARGVVRGAVEQSLDDASPALGGSYVVSAVPDVGGDCELRLTLAKAPAVHSER